MTANYTPRLPSLDHQVCALDKSAGRGSFAYLMGFGTGKSHTLVTDAGRLVAEGSIRGVVMVAPKGCFADWGTDFDGHWAKSLDPAIPLRGHLWRGGHSKRDQAEIAALDSHDGLSVLTVNVEALSTGRRAESIISQFVAARGTVLMAVDESTTIRTPGAGRTKAVTRLGGLSGVRYRRILTGLPTPHSSLDLYAQFRYLDWRILGYTSFWTYRSRYAIVEPRWFGGRAVKIVTGYQNTEELWGKIEPHSYRIATDECLTLPPPSWRKWEVEMTKEQHLAYQSMLQTCQLQLEGAEHVSATLVITQMIKLHQIVAGFVTDDDGFVHPIRSNRLDALVDLLEDAQEPKTVIWCHWRPAIDQIIDRLSKEYGPNSVVAYHGGVSDINRKVALERFRTDKECLFIVANQQVAGRSINDMVVARHAIYYSSPFDLELRLNSEARTRRKGSEGHDSIIYTDLTTPGTVEEKVVTALRARMDLASIIMGEGWREWLI